MVRERRLRQERVSTRLLVIGAALFVLAAIFVVRWLGNVPPPWYPRCLFREMTGWHCPGCGTARAIHALLQGDWTAAIAHNALLFALAPWLLPWALEACWRGIRHARAPRVPPTGAAMATLVAVLAFTFARNLSWWPLAWLAPDR